MENETELRIKLERMNTTLQTRKDKLKFLEDKSVKVEAMYNELKTNGTLTDEFKMNRGKLKSKISAAKFGVKDYESKIKEFTDANPSLSFEQKPDESESEILDELKELSQPITQEKKVELAKVADGFGIPKDIDEDNESTIETESHDIESRDGLTTSSSECGPVVVPKDPNKHYKDSTYYTWIQGEGVKWIKDGKSLRTIAGLLVHKFDCDKYMPKILGQLLEEATRMYPKDFANQVKQVYLRLDS